ncbi:hypothetical protein PG988_012644 [Apiospora saccharicola]
MAPQSSRGASVTDLLFPMLAPSLSSVGLDSMEELRDRIDDCLEASTSSLPLGMPSTAMGNVV